MSAKPVAPQTLLREKRRVLRRLAETGAFAKALPGGGYGLFAARNAFSKPVLTFEDKVAQALASDGLTSAPPRLEILPEGHAFLKRALAGEDEFLAQHREMGSRALPDARGERQIHRANLRESPLAWLASRKGADGAHLISAAQFEAGERLRADYTRGQLMARVTVDWQSPFCDGGGAKEGLTLAESAMAARRRVAQALDAVGPGLSDILIEVCCHLRGLEEAEKSFRWPQRAGKIVLAIALERLAAHYGLIRKPVRSGGAIQSWSAESTF